MTKNQAKWAAEHDWFRSASETLSGNWIVIVRADNALDADFNWLGEPCLQFADFEMLCAYAGY